MVFAEADNSSGLAQLRRLAQSEHARGADLGRWVATIAPGLDFDHQLAQAIRGRPIVLGYYFSSDAHPRIGELPPPVFAAGTVPLATLRPWTGYGANIAPLTRAARSAGFFNAITDPDGRVRTVPLLARYEGAIYESLALATYRTALGQTQLLTVQGPSQSLSAVQVSDAQGRRLSRLPTTEAGAAYVPFRGAGGPQGGSFRYVSAAAVLNGELPAGDLAGRIVLIGSTAPGLQDVRATPVSGTYPGVEVHANMISGMLDDRLPQRPDYARGYEIAMLLLLGGLLTCLPRRLKTGGSIALHLGVPLGVLALDSWLYARHGLVMPLAATLVLAACLTAVNLLVGYMMENRERRRLMRVFGTYVPPELVREMLKRPNAYSMQASSRELTVMFCDLQGFTRMSEHMDPAELQTLLNDLFTHLTDVIYAHGGTVDKYMGDCVMAFWGAPVRSEQHASQATHAALALQARVAELNTARLAEGRDLLRVCIGINSGVMAVGDMGSHWRRAYTVIGDAVNLASRLEALTRVYGIDVVTGRQTLALAPEFLWQHLDRVRVKGRDRLEDIYTPVCALDEASAAQVAEVQAWNEALADHIAGNSSKMQSFLMMYAPNSPQNPLYQKFAAQLALAPPRP
jgi:adenylate cyclase